jgi:hypothetical protein
VATPKGHRRDTDQAACHAHCHVWMHTVYICSIPGHMQLYTYNNQQCFKAENVGN